MDALLLLLLDSRAPAGGHNHSGGMEAAIGVGLVRDIADVEAFCRARLRTAGRVAASFAAAAHRLASPDRLASPPVWSHSGPLERPHEGGSRRWWDELAAEFEARTPSPAARAASLQLGGGLRRLARAMLPDFDVAVRHHPLVLGAAVAAAGGEPELAARAAALGSVAGPASAALRLLGLDPFAVQTLLAGLAREIDAAGHPDTLAADALPALDLLADYHLTTEVRLFAS